MVAPTENGTEDGPSMSGRALSHGQWAEGRILVDRGANSIEPEHGVVSEGVFPQGAKRRTPYEAGKKECVFERSRGRAGELPESREIRFENETFQRQTRGSSSGGIKKGSKDE